MCTGKVGRIKDGRGRGRSSQDESEGINNSSGRAQYTEAAGWCSQVSLRFGKGNARKSNG